MRRGKKSVPKVESPCVRICKLDNNICIGCKRTKDEISQWLSMTDEERKIVLDRVHNV